MEPVALSIIRYPYLSVESVTEGQTQLRDAAQAPGSALVWRMDAKNVQYLAERVNRRPGGLALIIVLPTLPDITAELISAVQRCRPHGLLPHAPTPPSDLAQVLRSPPSDLAAEITDYLTWRGLLHDRDTRQLLRRIVDLSAEVKSITALSRGLYMSRRALGRRLMKRGLPVPSHWLQMARLLRVASRLQNSDESVFTISVTAGYPDGFSMSNQMSRLLGVRPSEVRRFLGWEWLFESWLRREALTGGLVMRSFKGGKGVDRDRPSKATASTRTRTAP